MYNLQFTFLETNVIHIIYEMIDDRIHTDSLLVKVVNRLHKLKRGKTFIIGAYDKRDRRIERRISWWLARLEKL